MVAKGRIRLWLAAGLLCAALVGLGVWLARTGRPPAPAAPTAAAPPEAPRAATEAPTPPAPVAESLEGEPVDEPELPEAVQRYLAANVYPPDSGRLGEGALDLLEPNRRWEQFKPVPGAPGVDPSLSFLWTCDQYHYTSDQVVHARFEALDGDEPAPLPRLEAVARAEGRAGAEGNEISLSFRRKDDAWLAELDLARTLERHHGPVALTARYQLAGAPPREETIRIFVTPAEAIPARFTGEFRDRVRAGSLEIEVGIDVDEPGFYRVDANLHAVDGTPLGWATYKGQLAQNTGSLSLSFFGKALRDAGRPGPYILSQLRGYLFRDAAFPDRLHMRDFPGSYQTRAWALSDLSDDEWNGEHRQRMVELMLEDTRRGISLDQPPDAAE